MDATVPKGNSGVNTGRKLTPFHRPNVDPPHRATDRVARSSGDWRHLLLRTKATVAATGALYSGALGDTGPSASVGGLATGR